MGKKLNIEGMRKRVSELIHVLEQRGIAIPVPDFETGKPFKTRTAGAAGDKKREKKNNERLFLQRRIEQLEKAVGERKKTASSDSNSSSESDSL